MARYVDGFVFAVPKNKIEEYRKVARKAGKVWKEHGALEYIECIGDDVPKGKVTDFAMSVKAKRNEVVGFSWIVYRSRKHRDAVEKDSHPPQERATVAVIPQARYEADTRYHVPRV